MLILALTAFLAPASAAAEPPCALDLVGTWKLVSISSRAADGRVDDAPFGKHPTGMFIFTADGNTSVIISNDGRKRLRSEDRLAASVEEKANAFDTSFGYSGRYRCSGDRVVLRASVASFENWVGVDVVRIAKSVDGKLSLSTPQFLLGGSSSIYELVWERAK
jgi:hypothetical protein